jgi:polyisoprenoid-binding protein YceI
MTRLNLATALCAVLLAAPVSLGFAQTPKAPASKANAASPQAWAVDQGQSRIAFSTRWAGQTVAGRFNTWSADIRFDPQNLAASKAIVTIQTGSAVTGTKEPDENLPTEDWFNTRRFPTARYETTAIRSVGNNRYEADGVLTVKGVAYRLKLPFTLSIAGNQASMIGRVVLDRFTIKLGLESDASAEWVARETAVDVSVRATRR